MRGDPEGPHDGDRQPADDGSATTVRAIPPRQRTSARYRSVVPRDALPDGVACPFCDSDRTEPTSTYGRHMLTAQYFCKACRSSFDWVRPE